MGEAAIVTAILYAVSAYDNHKTRRIDDALLAVGFFIATLTFLVIHVTTL